jgi:23S rRNA pseudouridine2605 synthase
MFDAIGVGILRLIRTTIGPLRLGNLISGNWRHLSDSEVRDLWDYVHKRYKAACFLESF